MQHCLHLVVDLVGDQGIHINASLHLFNVVICNKLEEQSDLLISLVAIVNHLVVSRII